MDCWEIWGGVSDDDILPANVAPFEASVDVIRDELFMGGLTGPAFDGDTVRCDIDGGNFWRENIEATRGATVILRRALLSEPAGLRTLADCGDVAEGTASPSATRFDDIFVR
jgi:hypothetical protein